MWRQLAKDLTLGTCQKLPFSVAISIGKTLLAAQGFGAGGRIASSGETSIFSLINGSSPILFDVGGHIGEYSEAFLRAFPNGKSYSFEPSASHFALLQERLGAHPNVNLFAIGLGSEPGTLPLYKDREVSGLASLSQRRLDHFNIQMNHVEMVKISTVDAIVQDASLSAIDLLKIDVEGHELSVLNGAVKSMELGIIRLVQFEFGGCDLDTRTNLQDFFYFFKQFDFVVGLVRPHGRIQPLERYDEFYEHYRTTNFVAAPRSILLT